MMRKIVFLLLFIGAFTSLLAQGPQRFEKEVNELAAKNGTLNKKKLILFTGSSSIRMWKELQNDFPRHNVVNHGFGGSTMADLVYFAKPLIIDAQPDKVFIYEGDNDISIGRTTAEILADAEKLLAMLREQLPARVGIIFISAKPSVARWHLKDKYQAFNRELKQWTAGKKNVQYADVWTPMLDDNGEVRKDLFVDDNLHMNEKGYEIWREAIRPFLK